MGEWIINNLIVEKHPLWSHCSSTLYDISEKDYPRKRYFPLTPKISALDLDAYERSLNKPEPNCTGDSVIGITQVTNKGRLTMSSLLIVELRLKYKKGDNISLQKLLNKVEHSKELLSSDDVFINDKYCFIFLNERINTQAKSIVNREVIAANKRGQYLMLSLQEFKSKLKEQSDQIPVYCHTEKEIIDSLMISVKDDVLDLAKLEYSYKYWIGKINEYKYKYNINEVKYIQSTLSTSLDSIKQDLENGILKSMFDKTDAVITIELMIESI